MRISQADIREFITRHRYPSSLSINPNRHWIEQHQISILMSAAGIGADLEETIRLRYGPRANHILCTDPWRLYAEIDGVEFQTASRIWSRIGVRADTAAFVRAALFQAMKETTGDGNVYIQRSSLLSLTAIRSGASDDLINKVYDETVQRAEFVEFVLDDIPRVAMRRHVDEEWRIAAEITNRTTRPRSDSISHGPITSREIENCLIDIGCQTQDLSQIEALRLMTQHPVSILTGPPGSGKTTILKALHRLLTQTNPTLRTICVSLAARVARSFNDRTSIAADTVHKILDYSHGTFQRGPNNQIEADLVLVEEAFMIDNPLILALLKAIPPRARIILIGDPEQLEPIGRGRPVQCLLESGTIPVAKLTTNHRSAAHGTIPNAGRRIMRGSMPIATDDLLIHRSSTTSQTIDLAIKAWRIAAERMGGTHNVQALTARRDGPAGAKAINNALSGRDGYAVGDRIIQNKNDRNADYMNGELATVVDIGRRGMTIETDAGAILEYRSTDPATLSKAYCITYHKAQGMEYPAVINVVHPADRRLMSRAMLNVGITRAKRLCILIDQQNEIGRTLSTKPGRRNATLMPQILAGKTPKPNPA